MAKLDWQKANRRRTWAYSDPKPLPRKGSTNPALAHEIAVLTARIEAGHRLIKQLAWGDQRYKSWQDHLSFLYAERRKLRTLSQ